MGLEKALKFKFFFSEVLDIYIGTYLNSAHTSSLWYKLIFNLFNTSTIQIIHPEILLVADSLMFKDTVEFGGFVFSTNSNLVMGVVILTSVLFYTQFMLLVLISCFFIVLYGVYFSSKLNEENTIDGDYMVHSVTVESEEEIASLEDVVVAIIIVTCVFG